MKYRVIETTDGKYIAQYRFMFFFWFNSVGGYQDTPEGEISFAKQYSTGHLASRKKIKKVIWP